MSANNSNDPYDDFPDLRKPEFQRQPSHSRNLPFPDMTIPDTPAPTPASHGSQSNRFSKWQIGQTVLAPWEPHFLYVGVISDIQQDQALIEFLDGDHGWVFLDHIRHYAILEGMEVESRQRMGIHLPAKILTVNDPNITVRFLHDNTTENTTVAALRIPCDVRGPGAAPTKVASFEHAVNNLKVGDSVWAPWTPDTLYVGIIKKTRDNRLLIHFDDGDRAWIDRNQVLPFFVAPGMVLFARRKRARTYECGEILQVADDQFQIHFDQGGTEWVTTAQIVMPIQAFGQQPPANNAGNEMLPGVQSRSVVRSRSGIGGWLIPVVIGVALALTFLAIKIFG